MAQKRGKPKQKSASKARKTVSAAAYPAGVDPDMKIEAFPLGKVLDDAVTQYGDAPCTDFLGHQRSYADIGREAARVAAGLQAQGIGKGDRIGLMMPNCAAYPIFFFATLKIGAAVVNLNPLYGHDELVGNIRDAECALVVTLDLKMLFDKLESVFEAKAVKRAIVCSFTDELPTLKHLLFRLVKSSELASPESSAFADKLIPYDALVEGHSEPKPVKIDPLKDLAVLQFTGGTTGTPKAAMLTHANLTANLQQILAWFPVVRPGEERIMAILPFFHVFAMTGVLNFGIRLGALLILMPRFEMKSAIKLFRQHRPTILPGVPTLFNALLNEGRLNADDLASLRHCISGGAPLPFEVRKAFEKRASCVLVEGYGLSETSPVVICNPVEGPDKPGSIGLPLPRTKVTIRDIDDPKKQLPEGEDGEICVSGPQVMKSYWNKPEETRNAFVDGFFRTGDIGHVDEDGYYFIVDRLKDIINASGFKVYPRHVEEKIYEHPAVSEATVVGIADDYRGEAPKAFIVLKRGASATPEEILAFLKGKLSPIEMPEEIEIRGELPKTLVGKLSKKELRAESGGQ